MHLQATSDVQAKDFPAVNATRVSYGAAQITLPALLNR
jgi:hypothetical protein